MIDFVFDLILDALPRWLWWLIMTPLLAFLGLVLISHFWPAERSAGLFYVVPSNAVLRAGCS